MGHSLWSADRHGMMGLWGHEQCRPSVVMISRQPLITRLIPYGQVFTTRPSKSTQVDGKVVYNTVQVFSRLLQLLDMPRFLPLVNVPQFNLLLLPLKMLLLGLALPLSSPLLSDPTKRYYKSKIIPVKPGGCNQESRPHQRTHHGSGHS